MYNIVKTFVCKMAWAGSCIAFMFIMPTLFEVFNEQEAVLDTLGDVFTEPSEELEAVWEEALDSADQEERSRDRGRVDFSARFLLSVPIL